MRSMGKRSVIRAANSSRSRPAQAKMAASTIPSATLRRRVSRLPRRISISKSGRMALSWQARRRLVVPMRADLGKPSRPWPKRLTTASRTSARGGIATKASPAESSPGTSFMLWTARSISRVKSAASISLTHRPLPPAFHKGPVDRRSPSVTMIFSSTTRAGCAVRRDRATNAACQRASRLPRVPRTI